MTEIEKAIEFAQKGIKDCKNIIGINAKLGINNSAGSALPLWETILSALQEKQQREENKTLTNFDRITASPEALTDYIAERTRLQSKPGEECFLLKRPFMRWLNKPIESEVQDAK